MRRAFRKWRRVKCALNLNGATVARILLNHVRLHQVYVTSTIGLLTDRYDPHKQLLRLSRYTICSTSIAAIAIAAHEVGHATQHADRSALFRLRTFAAFLNRRLAPILPIVMLAGLLLPSSHPLSSILISASLWAYATLLLLHLASLPIEWDASRRGERLLDACDLIATADEARGIRQIHNAAARSYLLSFFTAPLQLLRKLITGR